MAKPAFRPGVDPERLVTGFLGDLKFLGPRPFPVLATPFFFWKCPSSSVHSLLRLISTGRFRCEFAAKLVLGMRSDFFEISRRFTANSLVVG